jgi:ketosteroid isomerase-like protein
MAINKLKEMVKKVLFIVGLAIVVLQNTALAQAIDTEKQSISKVLQLQQQAWNNGDIIGFMDSYWKSDSLEFVGKKGLTRGWDNTVAMYKKSYPNKESMGMLNFEILSIDMLTQNAAYLVGSWHLKRNKEKGDLGGYSTLLLKKINGTWVIVSDHSS